jgi:hypothetical protein
MAGAGIPIESTSISCHEMVFDSLIIWISVIGEESVNPILRRILNKNNGRVKWK